MTPIETVQALVEALEAANNGLGWYRDMCPQFTHKDDDEASEQIGAALDSGRALLAQTPSPPPECQSEAEKTAFAFGWWKAQETASAERDELRALWLEWEEGMYDGPDLLRRVRLALHRKDGLRISEEPT